MVKKPTMLAGERGGDKPHLELLRPLTRQEISENRRFVPVFRNAENRLCLFRILSKNYAAWNSAIGRIITLREKDIDGRLTLQCHLMNFLSTAYMIREHFSMSVNKKHPKNSAENSAARKKHDDFLTRLYTTSWHSAFLSDYRNYAQHCGLPIGGFRLRYSKTKTVLDVFEDARVLCRNKSTKWPQSHLRPSKGRINLVAAVDEYYHYLTKDYGKFVASFFFPDLLELDAFYRTLSAEVSNKNSSLRMVFVSNYDFSSSNPKWSYVYPPNSPFAELGIITQ